MLCLQSWGCACISPWQRACCSPFPKGTSAVPVPAPGVQGPEAVAELLASVCTRFLHPQRDWKSLWWLKILKWSFSFSNPGHPERENCLQGSGVAGISLFPVCSGRRRMSGWWEEGGGSWAAWCALVTLWGLFCWSCSSRGELGGCGRVMKDSPAWRLTSEVVTKKGETSEKDISELCSPVDGTTGHVILVVINCRFWLYLVPKPGRTQGKRSELSTWSVTL